MWIVSTDIPSHSLPPPFLNLILGVSEVPRNSRNLFVELEGSSADIPVGKLGVEIVRQCSFGNMHWTGAQRELKSALD